MPLSEIFQFIAGVAFIGWAMALLHHFWGYYFGGIVRWCDEYFSV